MVKLIFSFLWVSQAVNLSICWFARYLTLHCKSSRAAESVLLVGEDFGLSERFLARFRASSAAANQTCKKINWLKYIYVGRTTHGNAPCFELLMPPVSLVLLYLIFSSISRSVALSSISGVYTSFVLKYMTLLTFLYNV